MARAARLHPKTGAARAASASLRKAFTAVEWDRAACRGEPVSDWYHDEITSTRQARAALRHCREVCAACPIRRDCLDYALLAGEWGVWGGTTREERQRLLRAARRKAG